MSDRNQQTPDAYGEVGKPGDALANSSPWSIFKLGLTEAPLETKLVLAALVVFAGAFIILSWGKSLTSLLPAVAVVIVVGLIIALLATAVKRPRLGWLGDLLATALVVLVLTILGLFVSSAFFGKPHGGARLLSTLFGLQPPEPLAPTASSSQAPPDMIGRWLIDWIQNGSSGEVNVDHLRLLRTWLNNNGLKNEAANDFLTDPSKKLEREDAVSQLGVPQQVVSGVPPGPTTNVEISRPTEPGQNTGLQSRETFKRDFSKGFAPDTWHVIVRSEDSAAAAANEARALNAKYPNLYFEETQSNAKMWMVTLGSGMGARDANQVYSIARQLPDFKDAYRYCWGVGVTDPDRQCKQ